MDMFCSSPLFAFRISTHTENVESTLTQGGGSVCDFRATDAENEWRRAKIGVSNHGESRRQCGPSWQQRGDMMMLASPSLGKAGLFSAKLSITSIGLSALGKAAGEDVARLRTRISPQTGPCGRTVLPMRGLLCGGRSGIRRY